MKNMIGGMIIGGLLVVVGGLGMAAENAGVQFAGKPGAGTGKEVVLIGADEEYGSEQSMGMLGQLLAERHGFDCTVLFGIDPETGAINNRQVDNIPGLAALDTADLMVVFTRFQTLPDAQMKHIADYLESGRPVIGVRTATHAFGSFSAATRPKEASGTYARLEWNYSGEEFAGGFSRQVLGQSHLNHWGFHGKQSTRGIFAPQAATHPILRGIADGEIWGPTDVYEVSLPQPAGCQPLLLGQVLQGMTPESAPVVGEQLNPKWKRMITPNEPMLPIAWTYARPVGQRGRVFTTTMGGAMAGGSDFACEGFRRLMVNAVYWCVGLDGKIPEKSDVRPVLVQSPFRVGVTPLAAMRAASPAIGVRAGDSVLFYGNAMVERLLESGHLEARLQLAHPDGNLRVRSLAWTGDEIGYRLRPEGYAEHMKTLLAAWPANVVVLGYGMNESFAGAAGLAEFRAQYEAYLREIHRLHPSAKLVMLAPIAVEPASSANAAERNRDLAAYTAVIEELAGRHQANFVNLFTTSQAAYQKAPAPLTDRGMHLNADGCREMGAVVAGALLATSAVPVVDPQRLNEMAQAAAQKSGYVAQLVRPKNGALYYGVRKRPEENLAEMPRYHQLVEIADGIIHDLARHPAKHFADYPVPTLPTLAPGKITPYRFPGGEMKAPKEMLKDLETAKGYAVNLFASEEDFPDLRNPVQINFDARGRLWVVTMPSFPHTIPGEQPNDKILILEDTDHDGKADKCTTFAGGFDALDGVAFHELGVIVSAQPRLMLLNDTDGDDRADSFVELLRGVDVTDSHHGGMVSTDPLGDVIFSDGVFHRSQFETPFGVVRGIDSTTYRLRPATGALETEYQTMTPNPWKVSFDRFGGLFQAYGGGHVTDSLALPWTPLGIYESYGTGTVVNYAKGSAFSIISSPNFPDALQQGVASASLLGSYIVSFSKVSTDGGPAVASGRLDVLWSKNSTFRPADLEFGFDGALYVSDFSNPIIGHAQHAMRDPQWDHSHGRIWRLVHTEKPLVREWPKIQGANAAELVALLAHPQSIVRHHARIGLRKLGKQGVPVVVAWIDGKTAKDHDQALLEACWVVAAAGEVRPAWVAQLLRSENPLFRTAAVRLIRHTANNLPDATGMLTAAAKDPHPRVRMAVVNTVSHLRPSKPEVFAAMAALDLNNLVVKRMADDLDAGVAPSRGRSVPVLDVAPSTQVKHWIELATTGSGELGPYATAEQKAASAQPTTRNFHTLIEVTTPQLALLSVKHGYLDVSLNGVQMLSSDSPYSSEHQVQIELKAGLNVVDIAFRKLKGNPPPIFICDPLGQPLAGVRFPADQKNLKKMALAWEKQNAGDANALVVRAVPNALQFAPRELRVKAGQPVRLIFENPDLMPHNLLVLAPGSAEEIGTLADQMATAADSLAKNYLPDSPKILHATPLVQPNQRHELTFTAPEKPGAYPFICTFPGHWRIMQGLLLVE